MIEVEDGRESGTADTAGGAGVDLGEVNPEHDVEMTWRFGAGTEMLVMKNQVGQLERDQQVEYGRDEKGHQLQYSPGLAHAQ